MKLSCLIYHHGIMMLFCVVCLYGLLLATSQSHEIVNETDSEWVKQIRNGRCGIENRQIQELTLLSMRCSVLFYLFQ